MVASGRETGKRRRGRSCGGALVEDNGRANERTAWRKQLNNFALTTGRSLVVGPIRGVNQAACTAASRSATPGKREDGSEGKKDDDEP